MALKPDYHETRQDYERQLVTEHEAQGNTSALGSGCCPTCGEPVGMVRSDDGTERLGCKCLGTPEQLITEIHRLETELAERDVKIARLHGLCIKLTNSLDDLQSGLDQNEARVVNARNLIDLSIAEVGQ